MGRKQKYDRAQLANAALRIAADSGPRAVTVAAVAREAGAPVGSFYHRYSGRDHLLAELWLDLVEGFQQDFVARLDQAEDLDGAVEVTLAMAAWIGAHPVEARVLLLHRREDFVEGEWPEQVAERAADLEPLLIGALHRFARRVFGREDRTTMARLHYALVDAPLGGIRPYLRRGKPIPRPIEEAAEATVRAVLGLVGPPESDPG